MSQESEQKTEPQPLDDREEALAEFRSGIQELRTILKQREIRAKNRYENIKANIREISGKDKHRVTRILLDYLRAVTFDNWILLQDTSDLFDFALASTEEIYELKRDPEKFAKEVAPRVMALLTKGRKLADEDSEPAEAPDHRLFS